MCSIQNSQIFRKKNNVGDFIKPKDIRNINGTKRFVIFRDYAIRCDN